MSLDMNSFLGDVKRAAVEAVSAGKPFAFALGKVTSISPLKVQVDQKLELTAAQLVLTNAVRDYTVAMTFEHSTGNALNEHAHTYSGNTQNGGDSPHTHAYAGSTETVNLAHSHSYSGTKSFRVHLGLSVGEQVLLLRADGGQKYIILDRVEAPA